MKLDIEIIVSLISLCGTIITVLMGNRLTAYRIEQLEKKVEKHNNVVERVYKLEKHCAVTDEEIKVANHRIKDLEDEVHGQSTCSEK